VVPATLAWWASAGALTASIALLLNEAFRIMVGTASAAASTYTVIAGCGGGSGGYPADRPWRAQSAG
jgi:hypothetical protein